MRILSLLTSSNFLFISQFLVSSWFLYDFFLARDSLSANALWNPSHETHKHNLKIKSSANIIREKHCPKEILTSNPTFDKVILVVIDALGSNFFKNVANDANKTSDDFKMPFVESKAAEKRAFQFVAKAATPTVTMPRIKALLSGTIPSFVDLIYNLATDVSKFTSDNIISIAKAKGKSIVFYGDDTWLRLFSRDVFLRANETFSFFASDYTTVDTNVTKLAIPETQLDPIDWDYLILHYLGLDHIGHIYGTNHSPLIDQKLLEMDNVIKEMYDNMSKKNHKTLMIILGDHGMSEQGNHGGSTKFESETAMVFLPVNLDAKFKPSTIISSEDLHIKQIDFATNLALLTGSDIPSHSKGVASEKLLTTFWNDETKLSCAAFENVMQLVTLIDPKKFEISHENVELIELLEVHSGERIDHNWLRQSYFKLSKRLQDDLLEIIASNSNPTYIMAALSLLTLLTLSSLRRTSIRLLINSISWKERYLLVLAFLVPITMNGSTNFIESEFIFWPIYNCASILLFFALPIITNPKIVKKADPLRVILLIVNFILTSVWNKGIPFPSEMVNLFITFAFLSQSLMQSCDIRIHKQVIVLPVSMAVISCKWIEDSTDYDMTFKVLIQRLIVIVLFIYNLINTLMTDKSSTKDEALERFVRKLSTGWLTLAILLARQHNLLFLIFNVMLEASINALIDYFKFSKITKILFYIHLAQNAFYNQGNTNLFSSVDVRPAFFGQTVYNLYLAVPFVVITSFSTQIYWYIKLFQRIQATTTTTTDSTQIENIYSNRKSDENSQTILKLTLEFISMRNFLSFSYYMYVCMVLKNHLFIWSVISPKLVYHYVSNNVIFIACLIITVLYHFKRITISLSNYNLSRRKEDILLL